MNNLAINNSIEKIDSKKLHKKFKLNFLSKKLIHVKLKVYLYLSLFILIIFIDGKQNK